MFGSVADISESDDAIETSIGKRFEELESEFKSYFLELSETIIHKKSASASHEKVEDL